MNCEKNYVPLKAKIVKEALIRSKPDYFVKFKRRKLPIFIGIASTLIFINIYDRLNYDQGEELCITIFIKIFVQI